MKTCCRLRVRARNEIESTQHTFVGIFFTTRVEAAGLCGTVSEENVVRFDRPELYTVFTNSDSNNGAERFFANLIASNYLPHSITIFSETRTSKNCEIGNILSISPIAFQKPRTANIDVDARENDSSKVGEYHASQPIFPSRRKKAKQTAHRQQVA